MNQRLTSWGIVKIALGVVAGLALGSTAHAIVPTSMTVQGRLTDSSGDPLPPGPKNITFRIYNDTTGGIQVWPLFGGEPQVVNSDADGLWTTRIGTLSELTDAVFENSNLWLEVTVEDGTKALVTLPRIRFSTGPYAQRVSTVDAATGGRLRSQLTIGLRNTNLGAYGFVAGDSNKLIGAYGVIPGGKRNSADSQFTTISGGLENFAFADFATVGGGEHNASNGTHSFIGGGRNNYAAFNKSTVAGGESNTAAEQYAAILGGQLNYVDGYGAVICGGIKNNVGGAYSGAMSGFANDVSGISSMIGGGDSNSVSGSRSAVLCGFNNEVSGGSSCAFGEGSTVSSGW